MNSARIVFCLAVVCGACSLAALPQFLGAAAASAEEPENPMERAEQELEHAAEVDPAHAAGTPDPLSVDPDLAIWTLVVFVILLVILKKFAWGPILQALEHREHTIADHIAQAQRNHEQARLLLVQYEQKLATAAGEVRDMLEEARRDAEHAKQDILTEAKAGAEAERVRALRDIDAAAEGAMESIARRSAQLAVELAGKILKAKLNDADHERLIQEAVAKFPATTPSAN